MRLRELGVLVVLGCLVMGGCSRMASRLTFIKPSTERGSYTQVTPDYNVRQTQDEKRRMSMMDMLGLAGTALQRGDLDSAEKQARTAIKIDPKSPDPYTLLAVVAGQRGQDAAAGQYYAKAVQLAPTSGIALNNYGAWLCGHGRAAESLAQFDAALQDPAYTTPAAPLGNAGACALRAGQTGRAEASLKQALQLDPDNVAALGAMAQMRYDQAQYLDARAFVQRRLVAAPADPDALQLAARIEDKMGDAAAAARYRGLITGNAVPHGNGDPNGANGQ